MTLWTQNVIHVFHRLFIPFFIFYLPYFTYWLFSFLFFGRCSAIVFVCFCLSEPVKLCVFLPACFLVFKASGINTDVLTAYTLYSLKHLTTSRTFHNQSINIPRYADLRFIINLLSLSVFSVCLKAGVRESRESIFIVAVVFGLRD